MPVRPIRTLAALAGLLAAPLAAQPVGVEAPAEAPAVEALSAELRRSQRAHLRRVGAWGLANAVGGAALVLAADRASRPGPWAFGLQSGAWGLVNVGIAAVGLASGAGEVTSDWAAALASENGYADVLLVNLGLNVGYVAVGGTLLAVAGRGVSRPREWRGHGAALVAQGLGLLVLDGVAYLGTRARLEALVGTVGGASVAADGAGLALVVPL